MKDTRVSLPVTHSCGHEQTYKMPHRESAAFNRIYRHELAKEPCSKCAAATTLFPELLIGGLRT